MTVNALTPPASGAVAQADGDPGHPEMNGRLKPRGAAAIPEYTMDALIEYVEKGRTVGPFLSALLRGDLFGTFRSADPQNRQCIDEIIGWLRNVPPGGCYGSGPQVNRWAALEPSRRAVILRDCPTWQDFMRNTTKALQANGHLGGPTRAFVPGGPPLLAEKGGQS